MLYIFFFQLQKSFANVERTVCAEDRSSLPLLLLPAFLLIVQAREISAIHISLGYNYAAFRQCCLWEGNIVERRV